MGQFSDAVFGADAPTPGAEPPRTVATAADDVDPSCLNVAASSAAWWRRRRNVFALDDCGVDVFFLGTTLRGVAAAKPATSKVKVRRTKHFRVDMLPLKSHTLLPGRQAHSRPSSHFLCLSGSIIFIIMFRSYEINIFPLSGLFRGMRHASRSPQPVLPPIGQSV